MQVHKSYTGVSVRDIVVVRPMFVRTAIGARKYDMYTVYNIYVDTCVIYVLKNST